MKSCYQVLGLASEKATAEEVETAYRRLSEQFPENADYQKAIGDACATLLDPERRAAHDRLLAKATAPSAETPAPRSEARLHWLGLASIALAIAGYVYSTRPKPTPMLSTSQPRQIAVEATQAPALPAPQTAAMPEEKPEAPVFIIESRPSASAQLQFVRPAKNPGFDAAYLAWSTFLVAGGRSRGSGVMVARDKILTNCHVVAGNALSGLIVIHSATGERARVDKYAKLEDDEDVCLLNAPGAPDYPVQWGRSESLDIGANTHTVSFPGNEGLTWSTGQLLRRETPRGQEVLITSNYCRPGVSGGPLFDDRGMLMGITSAGRTFRGGGGECMSLTAETAQRVMYKPMVPIALAPTQYDPAMLKR